MSTPQSENSAQADSVYSDGHDEIADAESGPPAITVLSTHQLLFPNGPPPMDQVHAIVVPVVPSYHGGTLGAADTHNTPTAVPLHVLLQALPPQHAHLGPSAEATITNMIALLRSLVGDVATEPGAAPNYSFHGADTSDHATTAGADDTNTSTITETSALDAPPTTAAPASAAPFAFESLPTSPSPSIFATETMFTWPFPSPQSPPLTLNFAVPDNSPQAIAAAASTSEEMPPTNAPPTPAALAALTLPTHNPLAVAYGLQNNLPATAAGGDSTNTNAATESTLSPGPLAMLVGNHSSAPETNGGQLWAPAVDHAAPALATNGGQLWAPEATHAPPTDAEKRSEAISKLPTASKEVWLAAHERIVNDTCAICKFVPYEDGEAIVGLPCAHFFHRDCLKLWLDEYDDCPICRVKLPDLKKRTKSGGRDSNWDLLLDELLFCSLEIPWRLRAFGSIRLLRRR